MRHYYTLSCSYLGLPWESSVRASLHHHSTVRKKNMVVSRLDFGTKICLESRIQHKFAVQCNDYVDIL